MAVVFNGTDRLIEVTDPADLTLDVEQDIYSAWKDWSLIGDNSKYANAFNSFGGNPTVSGQTAPKYFFLQNYWRVYINNGEIVSVELNLYSENYNSPYVVAAGSGVSDRNSDAVNVNEEDIKNQSFINATVYINTTGVGKAGTIYPIGTPTDPSNNYIDAFAIGSVRNYNKYDLEGTLNLLVSQDIDMTHWFGAGYLTSIITLANSNTLGATFRNMSISGTANGYMSLFDCAITANLINFSGSLHRPILGANITLDSSNTEPIFIEYPASNVAGTGRPELDVNGANCNISIRGLLGGLTIKNVTQNINISVDCLSSTVEIHSSCTNGTIVLGGTVQPILNQGVGCTVVRDRTASKTVWDQAIGTNVDPNSADYTLKKAKGWAERAVKGV